MRKIEPELITGMGYIGDNPGVLYRMGGAGEQTAVTGNPALLEGVKGNRITSLTLHGISSQGSTTGAQLANLPDTNATISNGITWECKNGIITVNGTTTSLSSSIGAGISSTFKIPAGNYYISGANKNIEAYVFIKKEDGSTEYYNSSFSVNGETTVTVFAQIYKTGVTVNNEKVYIMLNSGSTALPWEPYTGGAPSPSPSYPQEIESAGQSGEISVDVYGGNLFDKSTAIFGWIVDKNNGNIARNERYACSDYIAIPRGISFLYQTGGSLNQRAFYDAGKIYISAAGSANKTDIPTNARYIRITSAIDKQDMSDIILNIGSTALTYEPYKPAQKLIIPTPNGLPGIPVSSGGNYTDKDGQQWVADEIDLAKGERVQWIEEYRFTGAEEWLSWGVNSGKEGITGFYWYFKKVITIGQKKVLNTHAAFNVNVWGGNEEGTLANISSVGDDYLIWSVRNEYLEDVSSKNGAVKSFKKLLGGINAKMLYCLATPIRTPLPPETIAAYKNLHTYSPTTTVINDAGAGMSVGYRRK